MRRRAMSPSYTHNPSIPANVTFGDIIEDLLVIAKSGNKDQADSYKQKLINRRRSAVNEDMLDSEQAIGGHWVSLRVLLRH